MKPFYKLLLIAFVLTPLLGSAQDKPQNKSFTLEQCLQYALENSINVKNAIVGEDIALAKVRETRGIGLPQVSATASIVNNPKLPRFFSKYDTAGPFAGDKATKEAYANLGVKQGDVTASKNFFQLPVSGSASATVNQILFNGSYLVGLQASKTYKELAYRTTNQTKEQVVQSVTKAYYNVLINKERLELFTSNIARVDSLLRSTKALNQNGFAEEIDVDRIQVTLNNLVTERDKFASLNSLGYDLLKYQMNYPMDEEIAIVGSIQDIQVSTEATVEDFNIQQRTDYQVMLVNQRLQELNIKNQYAAGLPSLNAFYTYGYNTQSPNVSGIFKTTSTIKDYGTIGPDSWYSYSQLGVSLNVPIFSGMQRHYRLQQEKLNLQKIQNGFVNLESAAKLEVKQARISFDNSVKSLVIQQTNRDLASKIARVTRLKYEQGVGSNIEVVDAENSLRQAHTNYYSALFDVMVAKVDLDKANGKLLPQAPIDDNK